MPNPGIWKDPASGLSVLYMQTGQGQGYPNNPGPDPVNWCVTREVHHADAGLIAPFTTMQWGYVRFVMRDFYRIVARPMVRVCLHVGCSTRRSATTHPFVAAGPFELTTPVHP